MESGKLCAFFILTLGAELAFGCMMKTDKKESKRIVGGEPATIKDRPYQVLLQRKQDGKWQPACGGVIFKKDIVLTAGHCLDGEKEEFRIVSGDTKLGEGAKHTVQNLVAHKNLSTFQEVGFDIGVIQVVEPFEFSDTTKAIGIADSEPKAGTKAVLSGWGALKTGGQPSMTLNKVDVTIADRSDCDASYKTISLKLGKTALCGKSDTKGMCGIDGGGPLTANGKLIGIASFSGNCGDEKFPQVFANVVELEEWIQTKICVWRSMKANHSSS